MKKPRICFLTHNLRPDNGAGVFSRRLVEGMGEQGYDTVVLTTEKSGASYERVVLYPSRFRFIETLFSIRKIMKQSDIVHALDVYPYGVMAALAGLGLKKPLIITAVATGAIVKLDKSLSSSLMRFAYRRANALVAISEFTKREILKRIPGLSISVIHHGVDFDRFAKARTLRATSPLKPYILGVGALRYRKGYDTAIAAFAKIKDEFPDLSYVIVGKRYSEDYFQHLKKLAADLGVGERVIFRDDVNSANELQKLYGGAKAFLLTSQNSDNDFEGFGLVFLEAAAAGLPIVGTDESGIEEATTKENALLVPPGDADAASEALVKVLKDNALREQMGTASLELARTFSWEGKLKEYSKIYTTLVG